MLTLLTGGKGQSHRQNLFQIGGSVLAVTNIMGAQTGYSLPPNQFTMGALGSLGSDSSLWCVLQDNATKDITPKATGKLNPDYYTFTANQQKYYFVSRCEAARQDLARTNVGVGERSELYFVKRHQIIFPFRRVVF